MTSPKIWHIYKESAFLFYSGPLLLMRWVCAISPGQNQELHFYLQLLCCMVQLSGMHATKCNKQTRRSLVYRKCCCSCCRCFYLCDIHKQQACMSFTHACVSSFFVGLCGPTNRRTTQQRPKGRRECMRRPKRCGRLFFCERTLKAADEQSKWQQLQRRSFNKLRLGPERGKKERRQSVLAAENNTTASQQAGPADRHQGACVCV